MWRESNAGGLEKPPPRDSRDKEEPGGGWQRGSTPRHLHRGHSLGQGALAKAAAP